MLVHFTQSLRMRLRGCAYIFMRPTCEHVRNTTQPLVGERQAFGVFFARLSVYIIAQWEYNIAWLANQLPRMHTVEYSCTFAHTDNLRRGCAFNFLCVLPIAFRLIHPLPFFNPVSLVWNRELILVMMQSVLALAHSYTLMEYIIVAWLLIKVPMCWCMDVSCYV